MVLSKKKSRTAWGLPEVPQVDQKINIILKFIAFHWDNYLKLNFKGKKVDILTKEVNVQKKFGINAKNFRLKKAYF